MMNYLKTGIRLLTLWLRLHPYLTTLLLSLTVGGAVGAEMAAPNSANWLVWCLACFILFAFLFLVDVKKLTSLLLIAALATIPIDAAPAEDIKPAAGPTVALGIGLGVLVGTGYVAIRIVRICAKRKKYTPPTNDTDRADMFLPAADADKYAGLANFDNPDYCIEPAAESPEDNAFEIKAMVVIDHDWKASIEIMSSRHYSSSQLVDFDQFNTGLAEWGIAWNGIRNERQYAKNGQAVSESEVPFILTDVGPVFYPDREVFHVLVETATALGEHANWIPLLHTWVPAGLPIIINDTPQGDQSFYRLTLGANN